MNTVTHFRLTIVKSSCTTTPVRSIAIVEMPTPPHNWRSFSLGPLLWAISAKLPTHSRGYSLICNWSKIFEFLNPYAGCGIAYGLVRYAEHQRQAH